MIVVVKLKANVVLSVELGKPTNVFNILGKRKGQITVELMALRSGMTTEKAWDQEEKFSIISLLRSPI